MAVSKFSLLLLDIEIKIYKTTDHPEVATTLGQIAQEWSRMGEYQKALQQFEKVLGKNKSRIKQN